MHRRGVTFTHEARALRMFMLKRQPQHLVSDCSVMTRFLSLRMFFALLSVIRAVGVQCKLHTSTWYNKADRTSSGPCDSGWVIDVSDRCI